MKLTQRRIEGLECPRDKKDILVFDDEQAGLGVRVTSGGGKWYLAAVSPRRGEAAHSPRLLLGDIAGSAREAVRALMGDVAKGRAPAAERKETAKKEKDQAELNPDVWRPNRSVGGTPSCGQAAGLCHRGHSRAPLCLREAAERAGRRTRSQSRQANDQHHRGRGQEGHGPANMAYGRACYAGRRKGLVPANPFEGIKTEAVPARDRVLSDAELPAVCQATKRSGRL